MKRIFCIALVLTGIIWTLACETAPSGNSGNSANSNSNANSNANAAKPVASAPTKDSLMEMDKKASEAWMKGDTAFFQNFLGDKFVMYEGGKKMNKAEMVKMVGETKCSVKTFSMDDSQMHMIDADNYAVVYKAVFDGECGGQKIPSPTRAVSLYTRDGDKWAGVFHGETMIIDPKNPPKNTPPPPPPAASKEEAANLHLTQMLTRSLRSRKPDGKPGRPVMPRNWKRSLQKTWHSSASMAITPELKPTRLKCGQAANAK